MAITDYASLQTAALNWLNRSGDSDATTRVLEWINLAEDELTAELAVSPLRQGETYNASLTISSEFTALPANLVQIRSLKLSGSPATPMELAAPNNVNRWLSLVGSLGKPIFYSIEGNQLRSIPAPDATYTGIMDEELLPSLSNSTTTNWLLTTHPKIYLFAVLAEADRYYRDGDAYTADTTVWKTLFNKHFAGSGPSSTGASLQIHTDGSTP